MIDKKGQAFTLTVILAMLLLTIVLTALIPVFFLKIHIVRVVEMQYGYSNAGLTLLTLLSDSNIYDKLSLYVAGMEDNGVGGFTRAATESLLISRLDKLVPSGCYRLSYSGGTIVNPKECDTEYTVSAYMALPYGSGAEKVTLDILTGPAEEPEFIKYCCYEPFAAGVECATVDECDDKRWEVSSAECEDPAYDCVSR